MTASPDDDRDRRFMELALAQAEAAAAAGQTPFGAVVVDREGNVVGEGYNTVRADRDPTAHGEVVALRDAWRRLGDRERLAGCTVYTSCEPCLMCTYAITQLRVARVVYAARGTDVPTYKGLLGQSLGKAAVWINQQPDWAKIEVRADYMRGEAKRMLDAFDWSGA